MAARGRPHASTASHAAMVRHRGSLGDFAPFWQGTRRALRQLIGRGGRKLAQAGAALHQRVSASQRIWRRPRVASVFSDCRRCEPGLAHPGRRHPSHSRRRPADRSKVGVQRLQPVSFADLPGPRVLAGSGGANLRSAARSWLGALKWAQIGRAGWPSQKVRLGEFAVLVQAQPNWSSNPSAGSGSRPELSRARARPSQAAEGSTMTYFGRSPGDLRVTAV
jgi:hypothetical protein